MISNKGHINDLELDNRSKEKNMETLNKKVRELMDENQSLR
jgi:hypothetical protein